MVKINEYNTIQHYGVRGCISNSWFKSYLTERIQEVNINGEKSDTLKVQHGVPQGSVLGPLLFLIYINDLNNAVIHSIVYHFADDTSILNVNKSIKKINSSVNHDLKHLCVWLRANKISLNSAKTTLVILRSRYKSVITKRLNFRISGQKLYTSKSVKYLGIHLDEHLNWDTQINSVLKKLRQNTGMLAKIRHYINSKTLLNIYYAIFNSHLTYGCQIWGQSRNPLNNRIRSIQNKAIRIINFKTSMDSTKQLYIKSNILKINDYISLLNYMLVYSHLNEQSSFFICQIIYPCQINSFLSYSISCKR